MASNLDKLRNDSEVEKISFDNIDKDFSDMEFIEGFEPKKKHDFSSVFSFLVLIVLAVLVVMCVRVVTTMKIVQGDVDGSNFEVAGFSFVDKDYDPLIHLGENSIIYYDAPTSSENDFFNLESKFSVGKVTGRNENGVYVSSGIKDTLVKNEQINYVLDE